MVCDYFKRKLTIREQSLPLIPLESYLVPARSNMIINVTTSTNKTGIVASQELAPGVYVGNCLVNAVNRTCAVSIINTSEKSIKLTSPYVTLEDLSEKEKFKGVYNTKYKENGIKTPSSRSIRLKQSLRL